MYFNDYEWVKVNKEVYGKSAMLLDYPRNLFTYVLYLRGQKEGIQSVSDMNFTMCDNYEMDDVFDFISTRITTQEYLLIEKAFNQGMDANLIADIQDIDIDYRGRNEKIHSALKFACKKIARSNPCIKAIRKGMCEV